jgi:hypothetical protein
MLSSSVSKHRTSSDRHKQALKARAEAIATSTQESAEIVTHTSAVLNLADLFLGGPSDDSDEESMPWAANQNPFEETMTYGDEIFDAEGQQILFSAGKIPLDTSSDAVWNDFSNLEYYNHTVFGEMTPMMEQLLDHTDDCMVADSVAAMAAMGG